MILWTKAGLLNDLSIWVVPMCCDYICMVCLMRRLPFHLLFLMLFTNFWSAVIHSSDAGFSLLHFLYGFWSFSCIVVFGSSTWQNKIAPLRLPPVARLSFKYISKWIKRFMKFSNSEKHLQPNWCSFLFRRSVRNKSEAQQQLWRYIRNTNLGCLV